MKIAVFDHVGNFGGGSRFARALLLALKNEYPALQITLFGNQASLIREDLTNEFLQAGIDVHFLASNETPERSLFYKIIKKTSSLCGFGPTLPPSTEVHKEIEVLAKGYDIAFFPWPYFLECPDLECPMVAVFHDFNYKYFFGAQIFSEIQFKSLNRQIREWLLRVTPIVSSRFTAAELAHFYPTSAEKPRIVHLAPFDVSNISKSEAQNLITDMGINTPYILYPTNLCRHKNIGILLRAMYLLRKKGVELTLVITGPGTECASGTASEHGVEKENPDPNVIGLGYVSNLQIDALIQCAKVVISTSLYEAGNGPGVEAWGRGVPVIMSDIPSFVEHIEVLGVKAALVDPYNANDVAEKIYSVISNYDQAIIDAGISRNNLGRYTWKNVARQYHDIFSILVQTPK